MYNVYAESLDADGDASAPGDSMAVTVLPATPAITSPGDQTQLNQSEPTLAVTGVDPSATLTLYDFDVQSGTTTAVPSRTTVGSGGTATLTPTAALADGMHHLYVSQTVNNVESDRSDATTVTLTTSAPTLAVDDLVNGSTNENRPMLEVSGAIANNGNNTSMVDFYIDGQFAGETSSGGGGDTGFQPASSLADGPHTAYAVTVDDEGHVNTAAPSNTVSFTVQTPPRCRSSPLRPPATR